MEDSYQILYQNKEKKEKWCIIDIDGVLNDYPQCWLDFIKKEIGEAYPTLGMAKKAISYYTYKELKMKYRTSSYKRSIKPREGAKQFLDSLQKLGYSIAIVTSRDVNLSYEDTEVWLRKNRLKYNKLVFDNKKHSKVFEMFPFAHFIVDDNTYLANLFNRFGIRSFLFLSLQNKDYECLGSVHRVKSFDEIMRIIQ